ncbi:mechanosensitive ion channel domain-containing protein [Rhodopila sp.]|uniref:mechanosensitive ion channel domain-containing protein n=1 Tax=Rhodopila sp. TaxID=2480087 RepID=UPI003D11D88A
MFGLTSHIGIAAPTAPNASLPPISAEQARAALDVLNDPAKRASFAATLGAIVKVQSANTQSGGAAAATATTASGTAHPATAPPIQTTVEGLTLPLAPDSLGAQVLVSASTFVNQLGTEAKDALDAVQSLPLLYGWAEMMATNPMAQHILVDVSWRLAIALACAAAVEFGLRRAMRRPIRALEATAPATRQTEHEANPDDALTEDMPEDMPDDDTPDEGVAAAEAGEVEPPPVTRPRPSAWILLRRVPVVLARLLLELIPVLGLLLVGHLVAGSSIGGNSVIRMGILAVIDSYAISMAILCVVRMLLSPGEARLRLFHLSDGTASYLMRWTRWLVLIAVLGYAVGELGLLLGLSQVAHDLLEKTVGLVLHICLAVIVVQKRLAVRQALRAPEGQTGLIATARNRLAAVWHWIALFFLVAIWLVWAVEIPHGFTALLHYFAITALVLIGARLTLLVLLGIVDRAMRPAPGKTTISPMIDGRLRIYHPVVAAALRFTIYLLCVLGLLQLYGMNTFIWLTSSILGLRIVSAACTILLTIVLAFSAWEAVNASIHNHLDRLQREAQLARSARLRTLLPLLRTGLLIGIAVLAGLAVLSEIGINIAPLLAGAGIIGVAIGFGSQKLVQDLITGIFLLLENAMQVGDMVTVSGLTGTVEALSVRTIRLRAGDGSVHLIPFSSVTSVTNVNRGLGNASVNVVVAYQEDTDRVSAELLAIGADMRNDAVLSAMMLSDLQLWGVDKVDGAGVTIAGQIVCTDTGRWTVQREFNRRMKRRFQELGIGIYNPIQKIEFSAPVPFDASSEKGAEQRGDHEHAQAAN